MDYRNIQVQENIRNLIKELTGFHRSDQNFKACMVFCCSNFKFERYLTINTHEIKRDINGICEKFRCDNLHDIEKKFRKLVEETVSHELSVNHYEKDVTYSILNLLITLSNNPIKVLKNKLRKGTEVIPFKSVVSNLPKVESDIFISSLLNENFMLQRNDTDSDLSDWSDAGDDVKEESNKGKQAQLVEYLPRINSKYALKPPEKPKIYKTTTFEDSEKWLRDNIQHTWWTEDVTSIEPKNLHPVSNFCKLWGKHLSKASLGFIKSHPLSIISEYCLMREIFWMFINPSDCKFFRMENNEIILNANVTLPSTNAETLNIFLNSFVRSMNFMYQMKLACLKSYQSSKTSHTAGIYFKVIQSLLHEVEEFIIEQEAIVKAQEENYTIVILHNKIRSHSKMLEMLWNIHTKSVLDSTNYPPHICATYLLASLHEKVRTSSKKEEKNLSLMILIKCFQPFLEMIDVWLTEAKLYDLKSEFIIGKTSENDFDLICLRNFVKSKEESFYLRDDISEKILSDPLIKIFLDISVDASFSLEIISDLDRVHEMRQIVTDTTPLFKEFLNNVITEIKKFSKFKEESKSDEFNESYDVLEKNRQLIEELKHAMITNDDDLMLLTFKSTFNRFSTKISKTTQSFSYRNLLEMLKNSTESLLIPLEYSIQQVISELLHRKFNNIFKIFDVFFFLESCELVTFFNVKLFPQIEIGELSWASPYLLTVALNDAVSRGHQKTSTLFSVEIDHNISHISVPSAINELKLFFNVNQSLRSVFTNEFMEKYNEVFRFLLKIKWGQEILVSLRFPDFFKHRLPYAKLQMVDLVIKRLALTRFAMQQTINSIHSHLMVILQGLSLHFDTKISKSRNISELIQHHETFVNEFYKKLYLDSENKMYEIIIEILKLATVLQNEWKNIIVFEALDQTGSVNSSNLFDLNTNSLDIEKAFKICDNQLKLISER
ncbi:CLUMA_CG012621, isoform A [Clunio marinus]|uniref:Gamma-tubulin complex component n=1 Tax=Clunio marinus TaxID=568069 RepID=A0A1J1IGV8_9DIPT|nr:CLUMA_CG012621, isoform A [Clunio marinus]